MNRKVLILFVAIGLGFVLLSSYEHGPAYEGGLNRTGSTGGAANCTGSGCHDPNIATTIVQVSVTTSSGAAIMSYAPGTTYGVTITGYSTASTPTDKFGFQVSAVNSGSIQAGTFAVPSGSSLRVTSLGGLQIVEHKDPLADTTANHFVAHFSWTAPAAGTGTVTFYGILNAIAGDGSGGSGGGDDDDDEGSGSSYPGPTDPGGAFPNVAPNLVLTEGSASSAVAGVSNAENARVYPNPFSNVLHVAYVASNKYSLLLFDTKGAMVFSMPVSQGAASFDMAHIPSGVYQAVLTDGQDKRVFSVVKE